jgi:hypothetical protein
MLSMRLRGFGSSRQRRAQEGSAGCDAEEPIEKTTLIVEVKHGPASLRMENGLTIDEVNSLLTLAGEI